MFKQIQDSFSPSRFMFYLLLLTFSLFAYLPYDYFTKTQKLAELKHRVDALKEEISLKKARQSTNVAVKKTFAQADPHYLTEKLGALSFLSIEQKELKATVNDSDFPGNELLTRRHQFITQDNKICLKEIKTELREGIEEVLQAFSYPIEIDSFDLNEILNVIERNQSGMPQLIITEFSLNKKLLPNKCAVYDLNMQILKRNFLL